MFYVFFSKLTKIQKACTTKLDDFICDSFVHCNLKKYDVLEISVIDTQDK